MIIHRVASTIASFMMNGMCCVWQMQEEDDRREAIRRDIRVEYERQRMIDQELWEQRQQDERRYQSDSSLRDDRRRQLLMSKMEVSSNLQSQQQRGRSQPADVRYRPPLSPPSQEEVKRRRFHSEPPSKSPYEDQRIQQLRETMLRKPSDMSSLFDSDDDGDGDEDDSSMVEVALQ